MPINQTINITNSLVEAYGIASEKRHEFLTPEHFIAGCLKDRDFWDVFSECGRAEELESAIYGYLNGLDNVPDGQELELGFSKQLQQMFDIAAQAAESAMNTTLHLHHLIYAVFHLEDSNARFHLENCLECPIPDFLNLLISIEDEPDEAADGDPDNRWMKYFRKVEPFDALIGREREMDAIIRVLCRKNKRNILISGGRGVGKSSLVRGLSHRLDKNDVPEKLQECSLLELNTGMLLSGTQYRGDLEGRVQSLMKAAADQGNIIIYIDDLRSLGGLSKMEDSSKDILSLLSTYFKSGEVRFIISATPEDVKRLSSAEGGIMGLFRLIDIDEPSAEEAEKIIKGIIPSLEEYHEVRYDKDTAAHAIDMSRKYILDRCLPDKAVDLLDESGALASTCMKKRVTKNTIDSALKDICRTDVQASGNDTKGDLLNMEERIGKVIYGQDKAVKAVTEAILMSKAGLSDESKAIGSFLFVGPTGVGKTELSKVLARQLHVPLHRFDMSEYSEKHSVAKLIGSPAGYVGYEDGGILTDTIRKNPYCVLLLDEIEKAHEDIYNLLLQVMDYAVISDNKGRKVDFRNVVLIMTSNAGARYAHNSAIGFEKKSNAGDAMAKEVKKLFAPEFINRLTSVVVFNDMDEKMAGLILDDKIRRLKERLKDKEIRLVIDKSAYRMLLKEGFSKEYGAREIERVLNSRITPMLMREILFGRKRGFTAVIKAENDGYILSAEK